MNTALGAHADDVGRRVIRFHLGADVAGGLATLLG